MNAEQLDIKILEYLDGILNTSEKEAFEIFLNSNAEARQRMMELKQVHALIKSTSLESPSKNFTDKVMANLDRKPFYGNLSIFNSVLLLVGIMLVVALCAIFVSRGFFDDTTTININQVVDVNSVINKYSNRSLPSFDINGKMMVNTIIILNLALGFLILDRAILKPWFQRRASA